MYLLGTFLQTKWQMIFKNNIHKITMLVKKGSILFPHFNIQSLYLDGFGCFPHLWGFDGALVDFAWGVDRILVVLTVNYLGFGSSSPHFWGIWWGVHGFFHGVELKVH